jgi:signal transduction histidine kinase
VHRDLGETDTRLQRLVEVGRTLLSELDLDAVLQRLLEVARELTGARYAAVGVLDDRREQLERFLTTGLDSETRQAIGDPPRGRGVLGVLIEHPVPLRLPDVSIHPSSYGFPLGHPPMKSFLGVPILLRGEAWGNLYLTDSAAGEFSEEDEEAAVVLADWAALAIHNARLYRDVLTRRNELERANRTLETTLEVARALGGETDLDRVLELVVKRSRALVGARGAMLELLDGDEFVVRAVAGHDMEAVAGMRAPVARSLGGRALRTRGAVRFAAIPPHTAAADRLGERAALCAPMVFRGRTLGVLALFDRDGGFGADHERLLEAFAASAATAVGTAQNVAHEQLRRSLEASDEERRRWARELHDETLQELAGLRVLLAGAARSGDADRLGAAVGDALEQLSGSIERLRALITDLRPASLDELGVEPALQALVRRLGEQTGIAIALEIDLDYEAGRSADRHAPDVELAVYRIVQEALTNVTKHANARRATVLVADRRDGVEVAVRDDGAGFETGRAGTGFGLIGMGERVALAGGTLDIHSRPGEGTTIAVTLPARRRTADRAAS